MQKIWVMLHLERSSGFASCAAEQLLYSRSKRRPASVAESWFFLLYYHCQGGYVFASVGLAVNNITQKLLMDFDDIFKIAGQWYKEQLSKFCGWSVKPSGSRNYFEEFFHSSLGGKGHFCCLGRGLQSLSAFLVDAQNVATVILLEGLISDWFENACAQPTLV